MMQVTLDVAAYHRCATSSEAKEILSKPPLDASEIVK